MSGRRRSSHASSRGRRVRIEFTFQVAIVTTLEDTTRCPAGWYRRADGIARPDPRETRAHGRHVMAHGYQNYIGGEWVPAASGQTFDDLNPADRDDLIGRFPRSDARDVDRAVQAAQEGFARWARVPAPRRAEVVRKAGETLRRRKDELGRLMTREMGKVLTEALGDVQEGIDTAEYMFGEGRRLFGVHAPCELPQKFGVAIRVPVGVVAAITPWNFPLAIPMWQILLAPLFGHP